MHAHKCKNQEECGQMWSGLIHCAPFKKLKEQEKRRGERLKKIIINLKKGREKESPGLGLNNFFSAWEPVP